MNGKIELVSIITPVYNSQNFLSQCIESVLSQTYKDWEMILVDDCSLDDSRKVILNYVKEDNRIKYIRLDKNGGAGVARNKAIEASKGKYLAFLDSDDFWHKDKLKKQITFLKTNNVGAVFSQYYIFNSKIEQPTHLIKSPKKADFNTMQKNDYIGFLTFLIDTEKTGKPLMPTIRRRQDWAFKLIIFKLGIKAYGIQEPLAYYRVGNQSLSSNKIKLLRYNFAVFRDILEYSWIKSILKMHIFLFHYFLFKATSKATV